MGETTGDGLFHWRKCYYGSCTLILVGSNGLNLKTTWWICFLQTDKMLTDGLKWCGLLWCFYQLFGLSFWRHPFTTKDPLARKRWNDTFLQVWWRNKLNYMLDGLKLWKCSFFFLVIYSFKDTTSQKFGHLLTTILLKNNSKTALSNFWHSFFTSSCTQLHKNVLALFCR